MIWQMIEDWFRGILTDGILSNLSGLFDSVNTEVGEIATQVGTTPAGWNAGIFNMIRSLSENVIVPIAGVIITFVMCYELIQLVIEKNNLHDLDTWIFFKWIFKTFVAVLLVTNTWNIVMGVFDITQSVVNDSAGVIISDTSIDIATVITEKDLTKVVTQMQVSMSEFVKVFKGLGVLIFLLIMYILTKQIIEKNSKSVSMTKILGFSDIEIGKLYIVITSIVVVLSLALSIPIISLLLRWCFKSYLYTQMTGYIPYIISNNCYITMFVLGVISYTLVSIMMLIKIKKTPLGEALKNQTL